MGGAFLQGGKKFAAQISLLLNYSLLLKLEVIWDAHIVVHIKVCVCALCVMPFE